MERSVSRGECYELGNHSQTDEIGRHVGSYIKHDLETRAEQSFATRFLIITTERFSTTTTTTIIITLLKRYFLIHRKHRRNIEFRLFLLFICIILIHTFLCLVNKSIIYIYRDNTKIINSKETIPLLRGHFSQEFADETYLHLSVDSVTRRPIHPNLQHNR